MALSTRWIFFSHKTFRDFPPPRPAPPRPTHIVQKFFKLTLSSAELICHTPVHLLCVTDTRRSSRLTFRRWEEESVASSALVQAAPVSLSTVPLYNNTLCNEQCCYVSYRFFFFWGGGIGGHNNTNWSMSPIAALCGDIVSNRNCVFFFASMETNDKSTNKRCHD